MRENMNFIGQTEDVAIIARICKIVCEILTGNPGIKSTILGRAFGTVCEISIGKDEKVNFEKVNFSESDCHFKLSKRSIQS